MRLRTGLMSVLLGAGVVSCAQVGGSAGLTYARGQSLAALKSSYFAGNGLAMPDTQRFLTESVQSEEHPIWSPDGQMIAFQRAETEGGSYNIWLMKSDGSSKRQLTFNQWDCQQPTWTPDGRYIAYREATQLRSGSGVREFDLGMIEVATGKRIPLVQHPGDDKHPTFSPDGRWMVFNSERDGRRANIYVVSASRPGDAPRRLTDNGNQNDVHPSFSRDGQSVLFHSYLMSAPAVNDEPPTRIGVVPFSGGNTHWLPLEPLFGPKHPFFTHLPGVLTFHAHDPRSGHRNIYVYDLSRTAPAMPVTDIKNAKHPQVSPDGRWLAYSHKRKVGTQADAQYDISVVRLDWDVVIKRTKK